MKRPLIAYFVYDLADQAVPRRLKQLVDGGADVILLGFSRTAQPPTHVAGIRAISLGRTHESMFVNRVFAVLIALLRTPHWRRVTQGADAVIGRNLECLAVAAAVKQKAPLIYEVLDIHRLLVDGGLKGRLMRAIEQPLVMRCNLIVTSSPAFLRMHLSRYRSLPEVMIVENKVVEDSTGRAAKIAAPRSPFQPWRIGWFGRLRCRRSLLFLADLAHAMRGRLEIDLRGTVDLPLRDLFSEIVDSTPCMKYFGAYTHSDLPQFYGLVHFSWAIDFFEEGLNSSWLLPNRLYEGCLNGAVPIAMTDVETGRWFDQRGIGITRESLHGIAEALNTMTSELYSAHVKALGRLPRSLFVTDERESRELVAKMIGNQQVHQLAH